MAVRSEIAVNLCAKKYVGEYQVESGFLHVFFDGKSKTIKFAGSNPDLLARLLLIEMVLQVPTWHE